MAQLAAPLQNEWALNLEQSNPISVIFDLKNFMYTGYVIGDPPAFANKGMFFLDGPNLIMFFIALTGHKLHPGIFNKGNSRIFSPNCNVFVQNTVTNILSFSIEMCSRFKKLFTVPYVFDTLDFLSMRKNDERNRLHIVASKGESWFKVSPIFFNIIGVMGYASFLDCGQPFFIPFKTNSTSLNSFFGTFTPKIHATDLILEWYPLIVSAFLLPLSK